MLTSSPTLSAPSSPSAAFHAQSRSSYHASRRTSASSSVPSPRFYPQVTGGSSRRHEHYTHPSSAVAPAHSPAVTFARSPQVRRKEYREAGTQYSPPGYPPTHRTITKPSQPHIDTSALEETTPKAEQPDPNQANHPAEPPTTAEPPEPELRIDPVPSVASSRQTSQTKRTSVDSGEEAAGERQTEANVDTRTTSSSLSKRARPPQPDGKAMPLKYETCDVKDLGILVSDMLMELVRLNDGIPLRDGQLTRFHSRAPPGISVRDYLNRLIVHATLSPPIILSMVFYVDRLCALFPAFTISSLTVHRFLITAATVAAKGLSDSFWTNSLYARVGGVTVRELALLELEFLRRLEWRIVPKPETLVDYYKGLVERAEGYVMEKGEEDAVSMSTSNYFADQSSASTTARDSASMDISTTGQSMASGALTDAIDEMNGVIEEGAQNS